MMKNKKQVDLDLFIKSIVRVAIKSRREVRRHFKDDEIKQDQALKLIGNTTHEVSKHVSKLHSQNKATRRKIIRYANKSKNDLIQAIVMSGLEAMPFTKRSIEQ